MQQGFDYIAIVDHHTVFNRDREILRCILKFFPTVTRFIVKVRFARYNSTYILYSMYHPMYERSQQTPTNITSMLQFPQQCN